MAHDPKNTYLFDEYEKKDLDSLFDRIKFFTDVEVGVTMEQFILEHRILSGIFMPVCSFDDNSKANQNKEIVSAIEGIVYPWFGVSYRPDRIQYSMENTKRDKTDHSRESIMHAQNLANLFVDEARLSTNQFPIVSEEQQYMNLINNIDPYLVEVPLIQSGEDTIRTELYLF